MATENQGGNLPPKVDPNTLDLNPDRLERAHIPTGKPPKQDPEVRKRNFREVFLGYDEKQAVVEATRCIHCPSPEPCILGCPVHNDIPRAMLFIEQGDPLAAANVFRLTSNLPEVCGRICPQEVLCEGACTVAGYDKPVSIGKLEAYCTDLQRRTDGFPPRTVAPETGRRVAVVGFGPAGIAVAEELRVFGHAVVVYDAWPTPGGLLVYGIPGFKLAKEIIRKKVEYLQALGVRVCGRHARRPGRDRRSVAPRVRCRLSRHRRPAGQPRRACPVKTSRGFTRRRNFWSVAICPWRFCPRTCVRFPRWHRTWR